MATISQYNRKALALATVRLGLVTIKAAMQVLKLAIQITRNLNLKGKMLSNKLIDLIITAASDSTLISIKLCSS